MSLSEANADFKWGKVVETTSRGLSLYGSFTYKGAQYFLYDCVCLLHMHSTDTDIGKIVKMWEKPVEKKKMMRVIWFLRPKDVVNFMSFKPLWNELFLACGKGEGVSSAIEVEKVHRKCNVICTSDDKRNPQPSDSAKNEAHYYFSSAFDVGTRRVLKHFPDQINNLRIEVFLNRKSQDHVSKILQKREVRSDISGFPKINSRITDSGTGTLHKVAEKPKNALYKQDRAGAVNLSLIKETTTEKDGSQRTLMLPGDARFATLVADKPLKKRVLVKSDEEDMPPPVCKRIKVECTNVSIPPSVEREFKRDVFAASGTSTGSKELSCGGTVCYMEKPAREWRYSGNRVIEVTEKPIDDKQKWFLAEPWEVRLQSAHEEGKLVFLTNLDLSYTSSDIEDIIWSTFRANADAKIIPCVAGSSACYGQAYIIFRTQDKANFVLSELARRTLLQAEGRPFVAFSKTPLKTSKSCSFPGHIVIGDPKLKKKEAQGNAVSTSHAAQDNTIEYDYSTEWRILQEKSDIQWKILYEKQDEERKELEKKVKDVIPPMLLLK